MNQIEISAMQVSLGQAKRITKEAIRNYRGPWLLSSPGVGKTSMVKQALNELLESDGLKSKLIIRNPAFETPIDAKGVLHPNQTAEDVDFLPIGEMRLIFDDGSPCEWDRVVVFLDDFGNATDAVKQGYMPFLCDTGDDRWVGGRKIRREVVFVVASNTKNDKSGVRGMLYSVTGRAPIILRLFPDVDEWVVWAIDHKMPMSVVSWIKWNPTNLLEDVPSTNDFEKKSNPRNVQYLGEIVRDWKLDADDKLPTYCGAVGDSKGVDYSAWEQIWENLPQLSAIVSSPETCPIPETIPGAMWAVSGMLAQNATLENFAAILRYTNRFQDREYDVFTVLSAVRLHEELTSTRAYIDWQRENSHLYKG